MKLHMTYSIPLKKLWISFILILGFSIIKVKAQDVICDLTVNYSQVENTEAVVFQNLERALNEFINNRKWTSEKFKENERIEFSMLITIEEESGTSSFSGNIQVQSRRPVYGVSYNTPLINHKDNDFTFSYTQFDQLIFNENNATQNNLTSIIAYYVYLVIGMDYDTFSPEGGTPYLNKALSIVNQNVSSSYSGWKPFDSQSNRYWIITNYLEARFKDLRTCMYEYHRLGMDQMGENTAEGRKAIYSALEKLQSVYKNLPNSVNLRFFFNAKADEIVNIYKEANSTEKSQAINLLTSIDPADVQKWSKINDR